MNRALKHKHTWLAGCATALVMAFAGQAQGQAFQGTGVVTSGAANISTFANNTIINIQTDQVVINWTPTDTAGSGPINFLPTGTTATFQDPVGSALTPYTVLNRILPVDGNGTATARAVTFNGTVQSTFGNAPIGNVWFYSPTGIIAGAGAQFNVGSLILTTNDIDVTGGLFGPGGVVRFRGPASSTSFITINNGAQINAIDPNAYVALVAPRIFQSGTVQANGSIAYVAAEQADIRINAGLMDIAVTQGTTDANGITHDGTTGGPASINAGDLQAIQMVAIPKNTALTMLLSGSIGYTPAALAANEGSSIVLLSGTGPTVSTATQALGLGNISIGNAVFTSKVDGSASNTIDILPVGGLIDFQQDTVLKAGRTVNAVAENSEEIRGRTSLTLLAGLFTAGGTINVTATGTGGPAVPGLINVTNVLMLDASASPDFQALTPVNGANGVGGNIFVTASRGSILTGGIDAFASGNGQDGTSTGGNGLGGNSSLQVLNNGTVSAPVFGAHSDGFGGQSPLTAGNGVGGTVSLFELGGALNFTTVDLGASGAGGLSAGVNGNGIGGKVLANITTRRQAWNSFFADASGHGGQTFTAGSVAGNGTALADGIRINVINTGDLALTGDMLLSSDGTTGIDGAPGYVATGGGTSVLVQNGGKLSVAGKFQAYARAYIDLETFHLGPLTSPTALGGTVDILAQNGTITLADLAASTSATGSGAVNSAGRATGGFTLVGATQGGSILVDNGSGTSAIKIDAEAYGAGGPNPSQAKGGVARLYASDGTLDFRGPTIVSASAMDGFFAPLLAGTGFNATGGQASVELLSGSSGTGTMQLRALNVEANGAATGPSGGTVPIQGNGGTGAGGTALVILQAGNFNATATTLRTNGGGGISAAAATAFQSGNGAGGASAFDQSGGTVATGPLTIEARGSGGGNSGSAVASQLASLAGNATGGGAALRLSGGTLGTGAILLDAGALGGAGMSHSGVGAGTNGGNGNGGTAGAFFAPTSTGQLTSAAVIVRSVGQGGNGGTSSGGTLGNGGIGTGGTSTFDLFNGSFTLGATSFDAVGIGGNGATGGAALGGTSQFNLNDTTGGPAVTRQLASLSLDGNGGAGVSSSGPLANGTAGLTQFLVNASALNRALNITGNFTANARGNIAPAGSGFNAVIQNTPLSIGGNATIITDRDVTMNQGAGSAFNVTGALTINSRRSVASSGLVKSGGNAQIFGDAGITMTNLQSDGTTNLRAINGQVNVGSLTSAGLVTVLGRAVTLASPGALSFADADATAGDLRIQTAGNLNVTTVDATGLVTLISGGALQATAAVKGGSIFAQSALGLSYTTLNSTAGNITARSGADISGGNIFAAGDFLVDAGGIFAPTGPIVATGNISLIGALGINAPNVQSGGTTLLRSIGGPVSVAANLTSVGAVTVLGRSVNLVSPGALTFADADATAGNMVITAAGNLNFNTVDATGTLSLTSSGGTLRSTGAVNAGGNTQIIGLQGITMASLQSGGTTLLRAVGGPVVVSGSLTSNGLVTVLGQSVNLRSNGALSFADADATAGALSIVTAGNLDVATVDATGAITLTSTGGTLRNSGAVNGTDVTMTAAGNTQSDANVTATGALAVKSDASYVLNARAVGRTITVGSADIAIAATGQLGARGTTQTITLTNTRPSNRTFIGGTAQAGAYSLTAAEAVRLFADQKITITTPADDEGGRPADFILGDLALTYGATGNIGTGGELKVNTTGRVAITGAIRLTTSSAADLFSIDPTRIDVVVDTGSIIMRSAAGALQGRLSLVAGTVAVANASTIAAINAASSMVQINSLLDQPTTVASNDGYLQAGQIDVSVSSGLFIQNSGVSQAYFSRRGFSANGFSITTDDSDTRIAINGQTFANGVAVNGLNTAATILINGAAATGPGLFDSFSSVNGCIIGQSCGSAETSPLAKPGLEGPLQLIGTGKLPSFTPLVEIVETADITNPPLIDEPVTGVGNDDLWLADCKQDEVCPNGKAAE